MVDRLLTSPLPALLITLAVASPSIGQARPAPTTPTAPRDVRPSALNGTAVIRGRVIAGDTQRPLRREQITVSSPELGRDSRSSSTDADGRYEVKDLPAGRCTVTVRRAGYLSLRYGQRRPFEQGQPLQVATRQTVEHIDFTMPKASLITGRVTDESGDAVEGHEIVH